MQVASSNNYPWCPGVCWLLLQEDTDPGSPLPGHEHKHGMKLMKHMQKVLV